jgi:hypothetical protein
VLKNAGQYLGFDITSVYGTAESDYPAGHGYKSRLIPGIYTLMSRVAKPRLGRCSITGYSIRSLRPTISRYIGYIRFKCVDYCVVTGKKLNSDLMRWHERRYMSNCLTNRVVTGYFIKESGVISITSGLTKARALEIQRLRNGDHFRFPNDVY